MPKKKGLYYVLEYSVFDSLFWVGTVKNRQRNHHFVQIDASDIYCLRDDRFSALFDSSILTSVFRPPPPPANVTVKYNNTLRQNNFKSTVSSTGVVPTRPFLDRCGLLLLQSTSCDKCCHGRYVVENQN